MSHEEVEFLLDKRIDRVITIGNEMGQLKAMLKEVEARIHTVARHQA